MNKDLQFAYKVRQVLNRGADAIDPGVARRLHAARQQALARQKAPVAGLSLAGVGHLATESLPQYARMMVAVIALLLGVVCTYYWTHFEQAAENEVIDSALLSDDLPPAALMDKGFQKWLESSSQPSQ